METLLQDLRYAARKLRRGPLFTLATVLTLALGIGLNTAVFSAVHALLLRPLPGVERPDRLAQLYRKFAADFDYGSNSIPHFLDLRDRAEAFDGVAAWTFAALSVSHGERPEAAVGQMVSAEFFEVMGVRPVLGRGFLPEEAVDRGEAPVAVLSERYWRRRFAADASVLGRSITVNGRPFTVVGVAPAEFRGTVPPLPPDLWVPLSMQPVITPPFDRRENRGSSFMSVVARLKPGVTHDQARASLDALHAQLATDHPGHYDETTGITLVPQSEAGLAPSVKSAQVGLSTVMMAVVGMLLLIACVNVGNLFLVRARDRRREMGIRLGVGARRGRIVRQLLTESLLFALLAGAAGLGLAWAAVRGLSAIRPSVQGFVLDFDVTLSLPVLLFALGITLVTAFLFGLVPALQASRPELVSALKGESGGRRGSRTSQVLVVAQVALSLILLVGAGLFLRSLSAATRLDTGFERENLLLASMDVTLQGYERERAEAFYRELVERVRALPGVQSAAVAEMVPLGLGSQQNGVSVPGYEPVPGENMSIDYNIVGPGYFETLGVPLRSGRTFVPSDESGEPVIVVNERMAERFWSGEDPVGRTLNSDSRDWRVIGVVGDGKYRSLGEEPLSYMYFPTGQHFAGAMTLHVRATGDPLALAGPVQAEIRSMDADLPVLQLETMESHLGLTLLPARLAGGVLGLFGVLGLLLSAVGLYGVMAYTVSQRAREIGIRVALGAERRQVLGMMLVQGGRLVAVGAAVGLLGAGAAARLVEGLLYGVPGVDPLTFGVVPLLLGAVGLLATWLPARRAAGVDPVRVLRAE